MAKQTTAQKMAELTENHLYNKILTQIKRVANTGNNWVSIVQSNIDKKSIKKFKNEGFKVEAVDFKNYMAFKISW